MTPASLHDLASRIETASGPDRELDATILAFLDGYTAIEERSGWIVAVGKCGGMMERSLGLIDPGKHSRNFTLQHHDTPAFTSSLDAAMSLAGDDAVAILLEALAAVARDLAPFLDKGEYIKDALPRFVTAACLRSRASQVQS